ncbi:MAG: cysteine--tRNA ligase [Candidatus Uhrbacteria bacterium]
MSMQLYNSLTKTIEPFRPISGRTVRLYACGPTVYHYATIANLRSYLFEDILKRTLLVNGYQVQHVMNITDVGHLTDDADEGEDKLERAATREQRSAQEIAQYYTDVFLKDLDRLHIFRPDAMPRATEYIAEQIALVEELERRGFTYETSDGVYFDTSKFPAYGKAFKGQKLEEKEAGARVAVRSEKRNPHDFALWKLTPKEVHRQQEWPSPWGRGFPGWHIECSVMSRALLGQPFDIHCGGIDHISVHHTNEIAQSEAAYDVPLAKYWCHGAFLTVDGGRMGKSEGNAVIVEELIERDIDPIAYRYLVLGAHYRSQLNFTWESLESAESALRHLRDRCRELPTAPKRINAALKPKILKLRERFLAAVNDDLDTPRALALLWEVMKSKRDAKEVAAAVAFMDEVLGLGFTDYLGKTLRIPREVQQLVRDREKARATKDWARADILRAEIAALGYVVQDMKDGIKVLENKSVKDDRKST